MLKLQSGIQVYLYLEQVDMRKAIDGLSAVVLDALLGDLQSGDCFIFVNRHRDKAKMLFWDRNGFVLYYKRLEAGKFASPLIEGDKAVLTEQQLNWFLAGLDFHLMSTFSELDYSNLY